jgi:hypothetical protein
VDVPDLPQDVLESLPLPLPLRDAFIAVWEAHVVVEGAGFAWQGRLASDADLDALAQTAAALAVSPPPPAAAGLPAALDDILTGLQAPMDVDFDAAVPPRPAQADLGTLRERLLIGTVTMRYQGHMTPDDARLLIEALAEPVDQRAVRRLYERTLFSGPPDRTSKTRTKRGSAAPSAMQDWQAMPLPQ